VHLLSRQDAAMRQADDLGQMGGDMAV